MEIKVDAIKRLLQCAHCSYEDIKEAKQQLQSLIDDYKHEMKCANSYHGRWQKAVDRIQELKEENKEHLEAIGELEGGIQEARKRISLGEKPETDICPECGGTGMRPRTKRVQSPHCKACNGTGKIRR
jgi:DNA repair exonuclease SbcCD ATPase subunit